MKVGNINNTKAILNDNDFHIKKKFGQNFIIDENILKKITKAAELDDTIGVIEIGPGLGSLTQHLAMASKKVLCYEIDDDLIPILNKTLSDFPNTKVIHQDILTADINKDIDDYFNDCEKVYVVANLPYYITTPILMGLLEKTTKISSYILMMQKEVADRICSKPKVKDYNALSIAVQYRCNAKKALAIPRTIFIPAPNVDSSVIRLDTIERKIKPHNIEFFFEFVKAAFNQRRKTLVNNISERYNRPKSQIQEILQKNSYRDDVRAEMLSIDDFIKLSDIFWSEFENHECWDLYDELGNKTDKVAYRGEPFPIGYYHLVVHIIVVNSEGRILLQKRSLNKIGYPGMWSIAGGSVTSGEDSMLGAKRELQEEMGIDIPLEYFKLTNRIFRVHNNVGIINDTYVIKYDPIEVIVDQIEAIDYKWATLDEIYKMGDNGTFVDIDITKIKRVEKDILTIIEKM